MFRMAFALFYDTVIGHARKGNEWKARIFGRRVFLGSSLPMIFFLRLRSLVRKAFEIFKGTSHAEKCRTANTYVVKTNIPQVQSLLV